MEGLVIADRSLWRGRSVMLTGHTGFKGSWLALWLHELGSRVHGYATDPPTQPSLFEVAGVHRALASDTRGDLADIGRLRRAMTAAAPEVVLHLAAQPLVRESYRDPLGTLATNIMGTANVLECARAVGSIRALIVITSDKVYEDRGSEDAHTEGDAFGGRDPYSASKAAAELVTSSYRESFLGPAVGGGICVATARAGNVIGGGDWATDRLVPDCLRAFMASEPVRLRYPHAVRPWQHVLEPTSGYLRLAELLLGEQGVRFASGWNFGPNASEAATVGEVAAKAAEIWNDGARVEYEESTHHPRETRFLRLDSSRARAELGWGPRWALPRALEQTIAWYRAWLRGTDMAAFSRSQIRAFEESGLP